MTLTSDTVKHPKKDRLFHIRRWPVPGLSGMVSEKSLMCFVPQFLPPKNGSARVAASVHGAVIRMGAQVLGKLFCERSCRLCFPGKLDFLALSSLTAALSAVLEASADAPGAMGPPVGNCLVLGTAPRAPGF